MKTHLEKLKVVDILKTHPEKLYIYFNNDRESSKQEKFITLREYFTNSELELIIFASQNYPCALSIECSDFDVLFEERFPEFFI